MAVRPLPGTRRAMVTATETNPRHRPRASFTIALTLTAAVTEGPSLTGSIGPDVLDGLLPPRRPRPSFPYDLARLRERAARLPGQGLVAQGTPARPASPQARKPIPQPRPYVASCGPNAARTRTDTPGTRKMARSAVLQHTVTEPPCQEPWSRWNKPIRTGPDAAPGNRPDHHGQRPADDNSIRDTPRPVLDRHARPVTIRTCRWGTSS